MKALQIFYDYYEYPAGISNIDAFAAYLQDNYHSFIKLKQWQTDNCCPPYFIESEYKWVYLNVARIQDVCETEDDVTVLSKEEYTERLRQIVATKCVHCVNYFEDCEGDNLQGHWGMISLDGKCRSYKKAETK